MKKGKVEEKIVDVITHEEYVKNPNKYDPDITVIEQDSKLYPIRKSEQKGDPRAGYYNSGLFGYFYEAADEFKDQYIENENNIIDFDNSKDIEDMIEKSTNLKKMEEEILTTPDNIYVPKISEADSPLMKGMKKSIIEKTIDIDKYKSRVPQFTNDKRLFQDKKDITFKKTSMWMEALDLKGTLIIEDKNKNVPNPMGKKVVVNLNTGEMTIENDK